MAKKILLADDSITIQKVVELTLMDQDYEVIAVSDGDQAMEKLETALPDLVIADVHMPGADGYEVCERGKSMRANLPVILLVGSFEPFDNDRMTSCGAELHLKKPFDSQELLRTVEELLAASGAEGESTTPPQEQSQSDEVRSFMADSAIPTDSSTPAAAPAVPDPDATPLPSGPIGVEAPQATVVGASNGSMAALSDADVERIAKKVIDSIGERVIREVAWDVIPDLAEIVIRERLKELEGQVE